MQLDKNFTKRSVLNVDWSDEIQTDESKSFAQAGATFPMQLSVGNCLTSCIIRKFFFLLDVSDIKFVINVDYPSSSEDYIHRIGRTARSDRHGTAYTFFTQANAKQAKDLVNVLQEANQQVSSKLLELVQMAGSFGGRSK